MALELVSRQLLGQRVCHHQRRAYVLEEISDQFMEKLNLQNTALGSSHMKILFRDLLLRFDRLTAIHAGEPQKSLREPGLDNLQRTLAIDVDDTLDVRAEQLRNRLPDGKEIHDAEMQSFKLGVCRTGRSQLRGPTPPSDDHPRSCGTLHDDEIAGHRNPIVTCVREEDDA